MSNAYKLTYLLNVAGPLWWKRDMWRWVANLLFFAMVLLTPGSERFCQHTAEACGTHIHSTSAWVKSKHMYLIPGTWQMWELKLYSSEASFWLIHPKKKSVRVCVRVRLILVLVWNTRLILVLVWGTYYVRMYLVSAGRNHIMWEA